MSRAFDRYHRSNETAYSLMRLVMIFCAFSISVSMINWSCNIYLQKKLRTTNKYSFQSCMTECTVDTILNKCDCLPFYYPESSKFFFSLIVITVAYKPNDEYLFIFFGFFRYESIFKEISSMFITWCEMSAWQSPYVDNNQSQCIVFRAIINWWTIYFRCFFKFEASG